jgi:hypothetical protein
MCLGVPEMLRGAGSASLRHIGDCRHSRNQDTKEANCTDREPPISTVISSALQDTGTPVILQYVV